MILDQAFTIFATAPGGCIKDFLGLHPWYYYLPRSNFNGCDIKNFNLLPSGGHSDIALVLAAILDDLLRIAGLVAVAYVIIGAVQYIASQGDPESTGRAQSTIINALIGLAVTVAAVTFVSFVGARLGG